MTQKRLPAPFLRWCLLLILVLTARSDLFPQAPPARVTVTGTVSDSAGKKIEGASVVAQSRKSNGTTTDANGRFILDVESGTTVVVSYVGFIDEKFIAIANLKSLNIQLRPAAAGETVIIT